MADDEYERRYQSRVVSHLTRRARELGDTLVDVPTKVAAELRRRVVARVKASRPWY